MSRAPAPAAAARRPAALALAGLLLGACAKKLAPTAPVATGVPPQIVASEPRAQALAPYDTDVWAEFARPLDPTTVSAKTVYLKLDNVRIPVAVAYEALTRRVTLVPQAVLALERTYTVEFSTQVHAADGTPPPRTLFFQFTTNSLRRTTFLYPDEDGSEGPFASLGWGGNGTPVDSVFYDVYAGTDSVAVQSRTAPPLQHLPFVQFLPGVRWPSGAVVYWSVTAENERTHERLDAPLRRFRTLPATTPVDSVRIALTDYGAVDTRRIEYCGRTTMPVGTGSVSGVHWSYAGVPPGARLADARMVAFVDPASAGQVAQLQPQATLAQNEWLACSFVYPGSPSPRTSGLLATATAGGETNSIRYTGDALTAYFEGQARGRPYLYGMLLRATGGMTMDTAG
ncbi:MAG TPA: Ig-like domain-containing protein, partial [Candidatus Eisenbacteria bacterium]|nr:Ig-like domain-containing protein [Candidatus Eisenbacteria bacterium]